MGSELAPDPLELGCEAVFRACGVFLRLSGVFLLTELMSCEELHSILHLVLQAGNIMNAVSRTPNETHVGHAIVCLKAQHISLSCLAFFREGMLAMP